MSDSDESTIEVDGPKVRAIVVAIGNLVRALRECNSARPGDLATCVRFALEKLPTAEAELIVSGFRTTFREA